MQVAQACRQACMSFVYVIYLRAHKCTYVAQSDVLRRKIMQQVSAKDAVPEPTAVSGATITPTWQKPPAAVTLSRLHKQNLVCNTGSKLGRLRCSQLDRTTSSAKGANRSSWVLTMQAAPASPQCTAVQGCCM